MAYINGEEVLFANLGNNAGITDEDKEAVIAEFEKRYPIGEAGGLMPIPEGLNTGKGYAAGVDWNGDVRYWGISMYTPVHTFLAAYDEGGRLVTNDPVEDNNCVNLAYFNKQMQEAALLKGNVAEYSGGYNEYEPSLVETTYELGYKPKIIFMEVHYTDGDGNDIIDTDFFLSSRSAYPLGAPSFLALEITDNGFITRGGSVLDYMGEELVYAEGYQAPFKYYKFMIFG